MLIPLKITFQIQMIGPLHIGTGFRRGLLHRTVVRDSQGHVYIPGSSLKGTTRSACEGLAELHKLGICGSALPGLMCGRCIVCRIFGSPDHSSSLFWRNAGLADEFEAMAKSEGRMGMAEARTQVQMSRLRGLGAEDRLFTTETARPGLRFSGGVEGWLDGVPMGDDAPGLTYELVLLLAGLHAVSTLGGNRSRGGGDCHIESVACEIDNQPVTVDLDRVEELILYNEAVAERGTS